MTCSFHTNVCTCARAYTHSTCMHTFTYHTRHTHIYTKTHTTYAIHMPHTHETPPHISHTCMTHTYIPYTHTTHITQIHAHTHAHVQRCTHAQHTEENIRPRVCEGSGRARLQFSVDELQLQRPCCWQRVSCVWLLRVLLPCQSTDQLLWSFLELLPG